MFILILNNIYECISICDYVYVAAGGACRGQKRALDPLGLELQAVVGHHMWGSGNRTWVSGRAVHASNC